MLRVKNIVKALPDGREILKGISFDVNDKEFVGILGPSGAGKSLTFRNILRLTRPTGGEALLTDRAGVTYDILKAKSSELRVIRQKMAVIFQGFNLVRNLPVLDNVMIGRLGRINPLRSWFYGFTDEEAEQAMATLHRLGMESFAGRIVGSLSGGEMQRVAVARALFQEPLILLADEPIGSLDPKNANAIMKLLQKISNDIPVCGVFHQPELTARYCSRIIGIRDGVVVYDGPPQLSHQQLKEIYGEELEQIEQSGAATQAQ